MAIHNETVAELQGGFAKVIEDSAMGMILENLQKFQYQYPVKSTIRELVSNAVDATKEKAQARAILMGTAKEEDFYIRREEALYRDSNFDQSYYDLAHLSDKGNVDVIYEEGSTTEKDRIRIIDQGVGLGGKRLEGYFKLGYSSKRNSRTALGKFGIGAKAALSTGVDCYTVINRYNGMEFHFNVYSHKVDPTIPPMDTTTGRKNQFILMYEGTEHECKAYWKPTTQPNGLEVIVETKKHKKQEYLDAVKSQLLYFDNVNLTVRHANGYVEEVATKANILYEDDYLIVSDNRQFSKPHLVINKVCYGYIDFQELELEQKMGNVGIRVAAEEVEVNPSRESVIWSEQTKATIQQRFRQAAQIATNLLQERLKTDDLVQWLRTWSSTRNRASSGNDVISRLAGIVDIHELEPIFPGDPTLRAGATSLLFPGMQFQKIQAENYWKGGKQRRKLKRDDALIRDVDTDSPFYITNEKPNGRTLRYLATANPRGFYLVRYPEDLDQVQKVDEADTEFLAAFEIEVPDRGLKDTEITAKMEKKEVIDILVARRKRVVAQLNKSRVAQKLAYVKVPADFTWSEDEADDDSVLATATVQPTLTAEERRKLEERVVAFTPRGFDNLPAAPYGFDPTKDTLKLYEWQKIEPKLSQVQDLDGEEIYYGTDKDSATMHLVAALTRKPEENNAYGYPMFYGQGRNGMTMEEKEELGLTKTYTYNSRHIDHWGPQAKVTLLKVAQDQVKHYKPYRHVNEFFSRVEDNKITMSPVLVNWYTAKLIGEHLPKLRFLENYSAFDSDRADAYKKLKAYYEQHYRSLEEVVKKGHFFAVHSGPYNELVSHLEKVKDLQLFARDNAEDTAAIAAQATTLFNAPLGGGVGIDLEMWDSLQELLDYAEPVATLFNEMPVLTGVADDRTKVITRKTIPADVEAEIRGYISFKGL